MKKIILLHSLIITSLINASAVYAQSTDVTKVQTFIHSIIQILVTLAGLTATGFLIWGGIGYITSSGNPESLDRSKKTISYSVVGLVIVLAAFVLSNIITQLATSAFGGVQ